MKTLSELLRTKTARLAGSVALGLSLLTLGLIAIGMLALALPAGAGKSDKEPWDNDWSSSSQSRVQGEPFLWTGRLAVGKTLEVRGINGGIVATLARGNEARVEATKSGRKSDPDRVKIEVTQTTQGILICALYPRPNGELNECGSTTEWETRNNDTEVRFKIQVPAGVQLVTHTVNGSIRVDDVKGDVEAATVNGGIRVTTSANATASTVNGSVQVRMGSPLDDDVEFSTVNGRVLVEMPGTINADVRGSTVHGSIYSDFPLSVRGRYMNRRIDGRIGKGGHDLSLSTVNGSIELRSLNGSRGKRVVIDDDDDDDEDDEGDRGDS
jgi:hypothetical protein